MKLSNEEMGSHLVRHINMIYDGSVPAYCATHGINYTGLCKSLSGTRPYSQEQVAPLMFVKRKDVYFEKED